LPLCGVAIDYGARLASMSADMAKSHADEYRQKAEECRGLARRAQRDEDKLLGGG